MKCPGCGHQNPATVGYCQKCGGKMDLTADEIQAALVEKARGEIVRSTEFYARQAVVFSLVLLLLMITLFVLAGGAPEESYYIPSASSGSSYVEVKYSSPPALRLLEIPLQAPKR